MLGKYIEVLAVCLGSSCRTLHLLPFTIETSKPYKANQAGSSTVLILILISEGHIYAAKCTASNDAL